MYLVGRCFCFTFGPLFGQAPSGLRLKVLPVTQAGVIHDVAVEEWKVTINGKDMKVHGQRVPKDFEKKAQQWTFVFLPIRDPEVRRMSVRTVASFMTSLPASDSVLLVMRTGSGLECLTPGFTTRPSLWAKALNRVISDLPARLEGRPSPVFTLPIPSGSEPEEGMEPVQELLARLPSTVMKLGLDDITTRRESILDAYSVDSLGGYATTVSTTLKALEVMSETLSKGQGDNNIIIFSKNEIDDLANPVWRRKVNASSSGGLRSMRSNEIVAGRDVLNSRLQIEMMIRDVTLAQMSLTQKLNCLGLTLHSVGAGGASYLGAFGESSAATGGYQFKIDDSLDARVTQLLPLWAARYELEVDAPVGGTSPVKVTVGTSRKGIRLFAPTGR